jgi:hypothetical protein
MERIKSFKLFESYEGDAFNIGRVYSTSEYINAYAFAKSGMCRANFTKNFKNWLIYKSYENILIYKEEKTDSAVTSNIMNSFKKNIESLTKCPNGYDENDFDYAKVIKDPTISISVNGLIKQISLGLSTCPPVNTANDLPIMKIFQDAIKKNVTDILDNIFWPGNMPTIKELKYIDTFDPNQMGSLGIIRILKESLEKTCNKYSTMEKDIVSLGKKFMNLLKEIGDNKIEALREMELPDVVTNTIVEYFSKSEDSFKIADEIRKGNEHIYNKIKALLPNIDTSADLGDLGF